MAHSTTLLDAVRSLDTAELYRTANTPSIGLVDTRGLNRTGEAKDWKVGQRASILAGLIGSFISIMLASSQWYETSVSQILDPIYQAQVMTCRFLP